MKTETRAEDSDKIARNDHRRGADTKLAIALQAFVEPRNLEIYAKKISNRIYGKAKANVE